MNMFKTKHINLGSRLNIKISSCQYRYYHYKDNTVSRPSYLYNGNPIPRKTFFILRRGPGPWFNIKTSSYQYRKSHCGDKTILRPSYLHNGIPILVRWHLYILYPPLRMVILLATMSPTATAGLNTAPLIAPNVSISAITTKPIASPTPTGPRSMMLSPRCNGTTHCTDTRKKVPMYSAKASRQNVPLQISVRISRAFTTLGAMMDLAWWKTRWKVGYTKFLLQKKIGLHKDCFKIYFTDHWEIWTRFENAIFNFVWYRSSDKCHGALLTVTGLTHDKSTLVQVMAWCRLATSYYLGQYWPRSM